jgi:transcriptional regulator with XRE-family HTH domain
MNPDHKEYLQTNFLANVGQKVLLQRKKLKVAAESVALAAGISRVTLHRIEKGEPGVNLGAFISVLCALGMHLNLESDDGEAKQQTHMINLKKIAIKDYPQLKNISWQLRDEAVLNAQEAKGIYERNEKYISFENLQPDELELIRQLGVEFKRHH